MNIFACHPNAWIAALFVMWQAHIVKMPLEAIQILYSAHYVCGGLPQDAPADAYKPTHLAHPCVLWTAESIENYHWLVDHAEALCRNYRWHKRLCIEQKIAEGKKLTKTDVERDHACLAHVAWLRAHPPACKQVGRTPFPLVINDKELPRVAVYTDGQLDVHATLRNYVDPDVAEQRSKRRREEAAAKSKKIKLEQ